MAKGKGNRKSERPSNTPVRMLSHGLVIGAIAAAILCAFAPILSNGWISTWDDGENFIQNPNFQVLGLLSLKWAWTTHLLSVYQPISWMILELEHALFGLNPLGYHLVSLLFHIANSVVLYRLCTRLIQWASPLKNPLHPAISRISAALAVMAYAVHPLRTETVAWVSSQPYLPATLFSMLAVSSYLDHHDPNTAPARKGRKRAQVLLFLLAGLLSKAIAVSVPMVLLILDFFPLRRFRGAARAAILEKLPLFAVTLVFMAIAMAVKPTIPISDYGVFPRLMQSCYGFWFYPLKTLFPRDLIAFYPLIDDLSQFEDAAHWIAVFAFVGFCAWAWMRRANKPGLWVATAAYFVILLPNAGIVSISRQIAADRYSYLSSLPWVIGGAYGIAQLGDRLGKNKTGLRWSVAVCSLVLAVLVTLTRAQCKTWESDESMWRYAYDHGASNATTVVYNLSDTYLQTHRPQQAIDLIQAALVPRPGNPDLLTALGNVYIKQGQFAEANQTLQLALENFPAHFNANEMMGILYAKQKQCAQAIPYYKRAIEIYPDSLKTLNSLGWCYDEIGQYDEAARLYETALAKSPRDASLLTNYANNLTLLGRVTEAISKYEDAIRMDPHYGPAHFNLGSRLAELSRWDEAEAQLREALRAEPGDPQARQELQKVVAARGRK